MTPPLTERQAEVLRAVARPIIGGHAATATEIRIRLGLRREQALSELFALRDRILIENFLSTPVNIGWRLTPEGRDVLAKLGGVR